MLPMQQQRQKKTAEFVKLGAWHSLLNPKGKESVYKEKQGRQTLCCYEKPASIKIGSHFLTRTLFCHGLWPLIQSFETHCDAQRRIAKTGKGHFLLKVWKYFFTPLGTISGVQRSIFHEQTSNQSPEYSLFMLSNM